MKKDFRFPPKVIVVQPAVPSYRLDLFDRLAEILGERLTVYASPTDMGALTQRHTTPPWLKHVGPMKQALGRAQWQSGALGIPIARRDIVIIAGAPRCLTNLLLFLKARLKGARTIWWGHYWSSTSRKWRLAIRLRLMLISHRQLFYTDAEVEEYRRTLRRDPGNRVSALGNGINISPIEAFRTPYVASERRRSIFFVGRLESKARVEVLLHALSRPELVGIELHVIGDGAAGPALRALSAGLGIEARVIWHGGTTDEARIAAAANLCRIFVYSGEVGLSLIHGMAYGLPAVVHSDRWTHMPEIAAFTEGETGLSFKPGDSSSLAATICHLIDDSQALERMSQSCLETVRNGFNTLKMTERFVEALRRLDPESA